MDKQEVERLVRWIDEDLQAVEEGTIFDNMLTNMEDFISEFYEFGMVFLTEDETFQDLVEEARLLAHRTHSEPTEYKALHRLRTNVERLRGELHV